MTLICDIYKNPRKEGMYLYVKTKTAMDHVPKSLAAQFGEPEFVMTLALSPEQKLARVSRDEVVASIRELGFFLQMPPGKYSDSEATNNV